MRNLLNLSVSLFICCAILFSGCGKSSITSLPSELRAPNTDYPKTVNILAPYFFTNTSADNTGIKQQWLDEMSERYNVKLNIISNDYTDPENNDYSASSKVQDVLMGDTTFKGLFMISDDGSYDSDLSIGIDSASIVPLEDYLADNPVWNALPDDFKSLFEVGGHIYAIPTSVSRAQNARVIRDEALEETGITVTDLDSFHDFTVAYAQKTGKPAIGSIDVYEMTDILNAFGLYPGDDAYNPFAYDPTEGCYVDFMTKGASVEAFEYLRELYKAGAVYPQYNVGSKSNNNIASNYRGYYDYDNCTEIFTLNSKYPQVANTYRRGFAMTKDTTKPKETINFLVYMLFGSEQNYLECWLGSSKNYILNSDGTITIKMEQDSKSKYVYPGIPNLTGGLSDIFPYSDANILYSQNGVIDLESPTQIGKYNAFLKQQYDLVKNGTVVEIPLKYLILKSQIYDANMTDVGLLYSDYFQKAITSSDQTVQQILDEYKAKMLNMGGNQMLDEMNAAIGKKTAYYYG